MLFFTFTKKEEVDEMPLNARKHKGFQLVMNDCSGKEMNQIEDANRCMLIRIGDFQLVPVC